MPAPGRDDFFVDQVPIDRNLRRLVYALTISPVRTAIYPAPQGSVIKASRIKFAGLLLDGGEERFREHNLAVDQISVALLVPTFEIGGTLVIATPRRIQYGNFFRQRIWIGASENTSGVGSNARGALTA